MRIAMIGTVGNNPGSVMLSDSDIRFCEKSILSKQMDISTRLRRREDSSKNGHRAAIRPAARA
jgi:hypothetical protein